MPLKITFLIFLISSASWGVPHFESSFDLDLKYEAKLFPEKFGDNTYTGLQNFEIIPFYRLKYQDSTRMVVKPYLLASPNNKSNEEQLWVDPNEVFLQWKKDLLNIQIGYNIVSWGVTDGYNPLDIVNPKQYFDPLHNKKRAYCLC